MSEDQKKEFRAYCDLLSLSELKDVVSSEYDTGNYERSAIAQVEIDWRSV